MKISAKVRIDNIESHDNFVKCRINQGVKQQDGTYKNCNFNAIAFKFNADILRQHNAIEPLYAFIEGDVMDNNYNGRDGNMVYGHQVMLWSIYPLAQVNTNNNNYNAPSNNYNTPQSNPARTTQSPQDFMSNQPQPIDDDELPF